MQKWATIWLQMKLTITEYSLWLQVHNWTTKFKRKELCTWYCVCAVTPSTTPMTTWPSRVLRLRGETEHDTNDNVTTKIQTDFHTAHMKLYTWHEHVFSPFVCFVSFCLRQHIHELHTTSRGSSFTCARHLMVITWWAYLFDLESSIPFYFIIFPFILNLLHFLLHFFLHFFHYLEGRSNPAYFAW